MTALSSSASMPRKSLPAASSFRTPPRRSPRRAKSSPLVLAAATRLASSVSSTSRPVTGCLFGKWSVTEAKIDGQELLMMKESDIMGIIDETAAKKKAACPHKLHRHHSRLRRMRFAPHDDY